MRQTAKRLERLEAELTPPDFPITHVVWVNPDGSVSATIPFNRFVGQAEVTPESEAEGPNP